jgi:hypothetical protein
MRKVLLTASFVVIAFLCVGIAAGAGPSAVVRSGNLEVTFGEGFAPKALSRTVPTPVALHLWSQIKSMDGSPPTALREFVFDTDANSAINVRGLPICSHGSRDLRDPDSTNDCRDAIMGEGTARFDFHFPEVPPTRTEGKLTIYNGGVKAGVTTLRALAYITVPITTAVVMTIRIERIRDGRFASRAIVTVPKIANGNGSLTSFSAILARNFVREGKRVSVLTAKCPKGKIYSRAKAIFIDGTNIQSEFARNCVPRD